MEKDSTSQGMDDFLKPRFEKYMDWLEKGTVEYSSKVVPVKESLEGKQWILPTGQVIELIRGADTIALANCLCRTHYTRCSNPVDVCLYLNEWGRTSIKKGLSREVSFEEAVTVLKTANKEGLVHLSLYRPDHQLYALCSCCACCCHDLQLLLDFKQDVIVTHSDYTAETDAGECIHCGECVKRCPFEARTLEDDEMVYNEEKCYGCGLCVTTCPVDATSMRPKNGNSEELQDVKYGSSGQ